MNFVRGTFSLFRFGSRDNLAAISASKKKKVVFFCFVMSESLDKFHDNDHKNLANLYILNEEKKGKYYGFPPTST